MTARSLFYIAFDHFQFAFLSQGERDLHFLLGFLGEK